MSKFTIETAQEYAARSNAARRANKERNTQAVISGLPDDPYIRERVRRTREEIVRLEAGLANHPEPRDAAYLSTALSKLSELERQLSGRPLPGTLRPIRERPVLTFTGPVD